MISSIQFNIKQVQSTIRSITERPVTVVAVTKNRTAEEIQEVINAGISDIGENRWQEASVKLSELPDGVTKHFIGCLQTNKVKDVVKHFDMIQSVDSLRLAKKIDEECAKIGKIMSILIQVNSSGEVQKGGVSVVEVYEFISKIKNYKNLKIQGLMTIAKASDDPEEIRACFKATKQFFDELQAKKIPLEVLSMGMSGDYTIALEEGATMLRVGKILFN